MSTPIHHPAQAEIERVREARDTLVELRDDDGLSLATYGKLSRAHDEIGRTLDLIRLEA